MSENGHALESKLEVHLFQFLRVRLLESKLEAQNRLFRSPLQSKRQLLKYRESDLMELGSII